MLPAPGENSPAGTVVTSHPSIPADRDLYTIPLRSSWFSWEDIHDAERASLPEFFDASSPARSPKIYKEYRDFIICKYREDPNRRLPFTEIRKSLAGDVRTLRRVFSFLDASGLINFSAAEGEPDGKVEEESARSGGEEFPVFLVEEGPPGGVKVAPFPNSTKTLLPPSRVPSKAGRKVGGSGSRMPPLTSYSDVFGITGGKSPVCAYCGDLCSSEHYESKEGSFTMCIKCFKNENGGGINTEDDFTFRKDSNDTDNLDNHQWTDPETLHLLEAIIAKRNDWALISDQARRSKPDCITRLIQLPFGEHLLGSVGKCDNRISNHQKTIESVYNSLNMLDNGAAKEHQNFDNGVEHQELTENGSSEPPQKRRRLISCPEISDSLLQQVALISKVAGPHVKASAADATVTAICHENPFAKKALNCVDNDAISNLIFFNKKIMSESDQHDANDAVTEELSKVADMQELGSEKSFLHQTFRLRSAIATAFGSAAARSTMLADQEDGETELLVATIIKNQVKKLQLKLKHLDELETIMEKEYNCVQSVKESILEEWVDILQKASHAGLSYKWREQGILKPLT